MACFSRGRTRGDLGSSKRLVGVPPPALVDKPSKASFGDRAHTLCTMRKHRGSDNPEKL